MLHIAKDSRSHATESRPSSVQWKENSFSKAALFFPLKRTSKRRQVREPALRKHWEQAGAGRVTVGTTNDSPAWAFPGTGLPAALGDAAPLLRWEPQQAPLPVTHRTRAAGIGDRSLRVTSRLLTPTSPRPGELLGEGRARHRNRCSKRKLRPWATGLAARPGPEGAELRLLPAKPRTSPFSIPHQGEGRRVQKHPHRAGGTSGGTAGSCS